MGGGGGTGEEGGVKGFHELNGCKHPLPVGQEVARLYSWVYSAHSRRAGVQRQLWVHTSRVMFEGNVEGKSKVRWQN